MKHGRRKFGGGGIYKNGERERETERHTELYEYMLRTENWDPYTQTHTHTHTHAVAH